MVWTLRTVVVSTILVAAILAVVAVFVVRRRAASGVGSFSVAAAVAAPSFVTDPEVLRPLCEAYFRGFNPCDVAARRCRAEDTGRDASDASYASWEHASDGGARACLEAYLSALSAPTAEERRAFERAVATASASAEAEPRVPWRIAVLDDNVEGGFPHTHGDVICMPRSSAAWDPARLAATVAHERVHVLQRLDPARFFDAIAASSSGRVAIESFPPDSDLRRRRRSNPDLDGYVYVDATTGLAYAMLFAGLREARAGGLGSARVAWLDDRGDEVRSRNAPPPPKYEHPHERLAYVGVGGSAP